MNFTKIVKADLDSSRRELSNGGLGIAVVLLVRWQIIFSWFYWRSNPAVINKYQSLTDSKRQVLREVILGEKPDTTHPQRVAKATAPKVNAKEAPTTRACYRINHNVKAFLTTKTGGSHWSRVVCRVTLNLRSGGIIKYLKVDTSTSNKWLHRLLLAGTPGTCTIYYITTMTT